MSEENPKEKKYKDTRNPLGFVNKHKIEKHGKKVTVYDARKRYKDKHGEQKEKFKRCLSQEEATNQLITWRAEIKAEREKAETIQQDAKFSDLTDYYLKNYVKPAVYANNRQVAGFRKNLTNVKTIVGELNEFFGDYRLRSITYEDIRLFYEKASLTKTRRKDMPALSTVNEKLSFLRRILNIGVQKEWLDVNPFKRGDSLIDKAGEVRRNRMLTFEEEEKLLEVCRPHLMTVPHRRHKKFTTTGEKIEINAKRMVDREHLIPLIICALDTAMRRGEIFNLEWWQIDFKHEVIYLTEEAARATKTGEGGILPLSTRLKEILEQRYHGQSAKEKIFETFDYKRSFTSACEEAGITNLQFRDLRSTGATRMVLAGNAESQVMKVTRHKQLKIFLEHYSNVDIQNAQRIGNSLDEFIEKEKAAVKAKNEPKAA